MLMGIMVAQAKANSKRRKIGVLLTHLNTLLSLPWVMHETQLLFFSR